MICSSDIILPNMKKKKTHESNWNDINLIEQSLQICILSQKLLYWVILGKSILYFL